MEGKLQLGAIKDTYLRSVARSGRKSPDEIARMLPAALREHSPAMAEVLQSLSGGGGVEASPAAPPPPASTATASPPPRSEPSAVDPRSPASPPRRPEGGREYLEAIAASFAPLNFTEPLGEPAQLRIGHGDGGVNLSWDAPAEAQPATAYRVVASDDYPPYAPEKADLVDVTGQLQCSDDRPFTSGVRYFQVWRNSGASPDQAKAAQPRLHAQAAVVSPVRDADVGEDEGRVIGQWSVWPGVQRVHVFRIPIERVQGGLGDPQYRILSEDTNLGGFVDTGAQRGKRYLYQFSAEAEVDGVARLSAPVVQEVLVSAHLDPVIDLAIAQHGDDTDPQFDLVWTGSAAGRVFVYRTEHGPMAGAENATNPESALPQMNLGDGNRLAHPLTDEGNGRVGMRNVPWPREWDRAYFTPVCVLDGQARVGRTVPAVRVRQVVDPVIVERSNQQVLKFGWPRGAASVVVHIGAKGQDAALPPGGSGQVEVSNDLYERLGGLQFPKPLPSWGCSVHMVGVSFVGGERILGNPKVIDYGGLLRMRYSLDYKKTLLQKLDRVLVRIAAETDLNSCPPFVLVHNPDRLPLHVGDGQPLEMILDVEEVTQPVTRFVPPRLGQQLSEVGWRASVKGKSGFIRLFVDVPAERLRTVALLDPHPSQLQLRS